MSLVFNFSKKQDIERFKDLNFLLKPIMVNRIENVSANMVVTLIDDIKTLNLLLKKGIFDEKNKSTDKVWFTPEEYDIEKNLTEKKKLKWLIENNIANISILSIPKLKVSALQYYAFETFDKEIRKEAESMIKSIVAHDNLELFIFAVEKLNIDLHNHTNNTCKNIDDLLRYAFLFNSYGIASYLLDNGFADKIFDEEVQNEISFKAFKQKEYDNKKKKEVELKKEYEHLKQDGVIGKQGSSNILFNQAFLAVSLKTLEEEKRMIDLFEEHIVKQKSLLNTVCVTSKKAAQNRL